MTKGQKINLIFFTIGILILSWMLYRIGLDTVWENIKATGWWFVPVIGIWGVVYIINAYAHFVIIRNKKLPDEYYPSFLRVLKITISGYAINYITPVVALGGEAYRVLELQTEIGTRRATSSTLSYNIMHILSHIVFWMCSIPLVLIVLETSWTLTIGSVVLFAVFVLVLYLVFKGYKKGLVVKTFRLLEKIPFLKKSIKRFNENKLPAFEEMDGHITNFYAERKSDFYLSLGLELLARVVSCFELLFIAKAIQVDMSFFDSIILYAGSTLFSNILFFSPMQLGTREGGLAIVLKMMGHQAQYGVFMGLVMRVRELCWVAAGLILMQFNKHKKISKI